MNCMSLASKYKQLTKTVDNDRKLYAIHELYIILCLI
jgi:hypothetical protein